MQKVSFKLPPLEHEHLTRRASDAGMTVSAYLRRLVQADRDRGEADALMALSVDALAEAQQEQGRRMTEFQGLLHSGFRAVSDQLTELLVEHARNAEHLLQSNVRLLGAHDATTDLVAAAMQECQNILDADNTLLESIDRRLRNLGSHGTHSTQGS